MIIPLCRALGELIFRCNEVDHETNGHFSDEIGKICTVANRILCDNAAGFEIFSEVDLLMLIASVLDYYEETGWTDGTTKTYNNLKNAVIEVIKAY